MEQEQENSQEVQFEPKSEKKVKIDNVVPLNDTKKN